MSRRKGRSEAAPTAPRPPAEPAAEQDADPRVLIRAPIAVRWRDLDAFNHVNNANYLTYLEEARLVWLQSLPGPWVSEDVAPVLAAVQIDYRRPVEWPASLEVELSVQRLGNTSLTIGHRLRDAAAPDTLYADGHVVLVWIDRLEGRAAALPDVVRTACGG